jgi:hypothetical protein
MLVNILVIALSELSLGEGAHRLYKRFMRLSAEMGVGGSGQPENRSAEAAKPVHLILQYYSAKTIPRQAEIDQCLLQNIRNEHISTIHVLTEIAFDLAYFHHVSAISLSSILIFTNSFDELCSSAKHSGASAN